MDLVITEQQKILQRMARDFLSDKCPKSYVREMEADEKGYSMELWQDMANLGWMGLIFPAEYGGSEMSFIDLILLFEEMGRVCLSGPFLSTVLLGGLTILKIGRKEQKQEFLPKISDGKMILSLAFTRLNYNFTTEYIDTTATHNTDNYQINGMELHAADAHCADYLLCAAKCNGTGEQNAQIRLFLIDAQADGIIYSPIETLSGEKQYNLRFNSVKVPKHSALGDEQNALPQIHRVLQFASVAKCAEMVGGVQQVLEMSVDYAKERQQFGQPIGSFQAIQHYCANMLIDVNASRAITYKAAWMLGQDVACTKEVSVAKAWVGQAYRRVCAVAHQIHGAIGFTSDHDLQIYSKRAKANESMYGGTNFHYEVVAQQIGF